MDFVEIISQLTNFVQNERVASYKEGFDAGCLTKTRIGDLEDQIRRLNNRLDNSLLKLRDCEVALETWDDSRTSEYWERHHPQPL